jgi:hypothetical protein
MTQTITNLHFKSTSGERKDDTRALILGEDVGNCSELSVSSLFSLPFLLVDFNDYITVTSCIVS